ncbi:hypothetical protein NKR19_g2471 [Coniochaeta hoffmannii]|uniref:Imidazoleglycerol-phosphate dehydratase n=1 Tax=Coniochaeta hoffmannii TaxID=91930 RepID=A0AA38RXS7_9PEZI|nr:hypothetical protein NKR19_g2471 [Coniochaeta hoffmannii]
MKSHNAMKDAEAVDAGWEATRGAIYGAIKWGAVTAVLGGIGYAVSPLYRGLTVQFKVYIQMSGMVFGSMIEADHRLREYEARVRIQKRLQRDRAMWQKFEDEYGKDDDE